MQFYANCKALEEYVNGLPRMDLKICSSQRLGRHTPVFPAHTATINYLAAPAQHLQYQQGFISWRACQTWMRILPHFTEATMAQALLLEMPSTCKSVRNNSAVYSHPTTAQQGACLWAQAFKRLFIFRGQRLPGHQQPGRPQFQLLFPGLFLQESSMSGTVFQAVF